MVILSVTADKYHVQSLLTVQAYGRWPYDSDSLVVIQLGMIAGKVNPGLPGASTASYKQEREQLHVKESASQGGSPDSDEHLMSAYAMGDTQAFESLYHKYRPVLFRFFMLAVTNESTATELYQDTWMKVIRARNSYQPTAAFSTWIFTISRNCLRDYFRKHQPEIIEFDTVDESVASHDGNIDGIENAISNTEFQPEQKAMLFEQSSFLCRALEMLPLSQREALLLRHVAGMSVAEIAESVNEKPQTIKSRLRYATPKLKKYLSQSTDDAGSATEFCDRQ